MPAGRATSLPVVEKAPHSPEPISGHSFRMRIIWIIQRSSDVGRRSCSSTLTAWKPYGPSSTAGRTSCSLFESHHCVRPSIASAFGSHCALSAAGSRPSRSAAPGPRAARTAGCKRTRDGVGLPASAPAAGVSRGRRSASRPRGELSEDSTPIPRKGPPLTGRRTYNWLTGPETEPRAALKRSS